MVKKTTNRLVGPSAEDLRVCRIASLTIVNASPDGFVRNKNAAFGQKIFHITEAETKKR